MAAASASKPKYTAYIIAGGKKYHITPAIEDIDISDRSKQIANSVTIKLANAKVKNEWLTSLLGVRNRVYLYADDGKQKKEVFRGFVWDRPYRSSASEKLLTLKCYDNLIYFQNSDHSAYFSAGQSTKDICTSLCDSWGVKLEYTYESITHTKLPLRGNLSDIFTSDILDIVKDKTGKKYVILSDKDVMQIKTVGTNSTVYRFTADQNTIQTYSSCTMDGMVTKVIILGKADDDERQPIEETVVGDTETYGTLQKTINRDDNTSSEEANEEAQSIIDKNGKPKWEYELHASDVPWIRKGDKIYVNAGDMSGHYIVTGINRTIGRKKRDMILDLEDL